MNWQQLISSYRTGSKGPGGQPNRSGFEIDFDRIIFSLPFRRLQDKTQVFPLPEDDFVHNRLTHSLEVASVGRSLGKLAGEQVIARHSELAKTVTAADFGAIVSAASLAHDVGNPPFGHAGERAISGFYAHHPEQEEIRYNLSSSEWADLIDFEGNAQGFRLINQSLHGLKLTYATLGAFTKYPRQSSVKQKAAGRVSQKKYGFFQTEKDLFTTVASGLGLQQQGEEPVWLRHPLAFLVEAADDICYHIIDLEDGCTLGLVSLDETIDLLKPVIGAKFDRQKLLTRASLPEKLGTLRALAINELINETVAVFIDNEQGVLNGDFDQPLTDNIPSAAALKDIRDLSVDRIYRAKVVLEKEVAGFEVIEGLLQAMHTAIHNYTTGRLSAKDKTLMRLLPQAVTVNLVPENYYANIRVMLDYVAGMTDSYALTMYRKLKGMTLPSW